MVTSGTTGLWLGPRPDGDLRRSHQRVWVAQVDRQGCELILSSQWPDKVGKGLMFISLDVGVLDSWRGVAWM
jgi:hypothetical protein